MSTEYLVIYDIDVAEGQEEAYRNWHDNHLEEVVRHVPGYRGAYRTEGDAPRAFVVAYELDVDPVAVDSELERAMEDGRVSHPPEGVLKGFKRTDLKVANRV